jgi:hypothetical protein
LLPICVIATSSNLKEEYTHPQKPSQHSQPSQSGIKSTSDHGSTLRHSSAAYVLTNNDLSIEDSDVENSGSNRGDLE